MIDDGHVASSDASTDAEIRCRLCHSLMPAVARVCKSCGARQDWQRHIALSSTVLALWIALISVISTGLPPIKRALFPYSAIKISLLGLGFSEFSDATELPSLYLVASNSGERAGVIGGVVRMDAPGGLVFLHTETLMVQPGTTQLIRLTHEPGMMLSYPDITSKPEHCFLEVTELSFEGKSSQHHVELLDREWSYSICYSYLFQLAKYTSASRQ